MSRASNEDLAMFAQVNANQPRMLAWLEVEKVQAVRCMTAARDMVIVHRFQGEVLALEKLIGLLTGAKDIIARHTKG